ncbi:SPFH domain-containing protein [Streptomyces sp. WL006]|uniref:SPFH domain-containing protein n=1 Tax=Streptomyces sp. WL006 TaxID=3423915 RepID=UPI003F6AF32E
MTPNDDQSPRTSSTPAPHPLDDRLPPSLFAPPGRGSPPPLFGGDPVLREGGLVGSGGEPVSRSGGPARSGGDLSSQPGADLAPPTSGARGPRGGLLPPPLFRPVEPAPAPERDEGPIAPSGAGAAQAGGAASLSAQAGETASPSGQTEGTASPSPQAGDTASPSVRTDRKASASPAAGREASVASPPGGAASPVPSGGAASSVPPRGAGPQSPGVSLHLGAVPDPDVPGPGRSADRQAPKPAAEGPSADRTAPARPAPLDGNLYFKPVRRARTEPSGEWTPHPSYGAEPGGAKPDAGTVRGGGSGAGSADTGTAKGAQPGAGKPEAGPANGSGASAHGGPEAGRAPRPAPARGPVDDAGPDTELDLVLDLAAGDRAASATFSVPSPSAEPAASPTAGVAATVTTAATTATAATGSPANASATAAVSSVTSSTATATTTTPYPARRHSVIGNETTASIPVHLLFRDDREPAEATALPAGVLRRPVEDRAPATRRPPVPRSPQTRVRPSTRPAPDADPRLTERPGPALPGSAALLAAAAAIAGGLAVLWWRGVLPAAWQTAAGLTPRPDLGIGAGAWALLAALTTVTLLALGGLGRGRVGYAWVLTLFGDYRGSVRRTGLVWVSPLLLRRRVDVRLRHWRSEPLPAVDATGTALRVVVLVVWRIKDTVRAALGIEDHEAYLSAQVEAALARVLSQLPADAFHEDAPSLRDAEAVGDALTRLLKADCEPVGVEVYSAQPTGIEYAPEVAAAMQRRRIAAIDSKHRDSVLTSVVDAVDDTVNRLTTRGIVELDDYERKALVKDLTVAFYTGRSGAGDGA